MRRRSGTDYSDRFPAYVPVAQRTRDAAATVAILKKKGLAVEPVSIDGRAIVSTFWGKAWCSHLESLSDFRNRLPRGRSYVRRGAVVHLALESGRIGAMVQGSALYDVEIGIVKLEPKRWSKVVAECTGNIDSLVELLRGKLSESVMRAVTNVDSGLFPAAAEIRMSCSCPDAAGLCKHLAAVLYGVGARLDAQPELLFTLRGVDPGELVAERAASVIPVATGEGNRSRRLLPSNRLSDVFGIEFERAPAQPVARTNRGVSEAKPATPGASFEPKKSGHHGAKGSRTRALVRAPAVVRKPGRSTSVATTAARVLAFIREHPGARAELIAQSLGLSSIQLNQSLKKLIATKSIISSGVTRGTKYFESQPPPRRSRS